MSPGDNPLVLLFITFFRVVRFTSTIEHAERRSSRPGTRPGTAFQASQPSDDSRPAAEQFLQLSSLTLSDPQQSSFYVSGPATTRLLHLNTLTSTEKQKHSLRNCLSPFVGYFKAKLLLLKNVCGTI